MSSSSNATPKGGFVQGIPQVSTLPVRSLATSGCCGSTDQASTTGCCGEPTAASTTLTQTTGCCGEPITPSSEAGCCN